MKKEPNMVENLLKIEKRELKIKGVKNKMTDKTCEYNTSLGEDLTRVPTGSYHCLSPLRGREKGEFGEEQDYFECDCNNHEKCFWYSQKSRLKNILKE